MGFLSRKTKPAHTPVVDETHPIDDELQEMQRVVPESDADASPAAPGREAEEAPVDGESPSPSPDDDRNLILSEEGEGPVERTKVKDSDPEEPERFNARDLIAPSRHEEPKVEPAGEVATKHAEVI